MASSKRKTKHRGNAVGMVESRGRTGRRPTAAERSGTAREKTKAREQRVPRYDRPPTWGGAFLKALVAAVVVLLFGVFVVHNTTQSAILFPLILLMYVPISYYTDLWLYRRRLRGKAKGGTP